MQSDKRSQSSSCGSEGNRGGSLPCGLAAPACGNQKLRNEANLQCRRAATAPGGEDRRAGDTGQIVRNEANWRTVQTKITVCRETCYERFDQIRTCGKQSQFLRGSGRRRVSLMGETPLLRDGPVADTEMRETNPIRTVRARSGRALRTNKANSAGSGHGRSRPCREGRPDGGRSKCAKRSQFPGGRRPDDREKQGFGVALPVPAPIIAGGHYI